MGRSGVYVGLVGNILEGLTMVGPFDNRSLGFDTLDEQYPNQEVIMAELDYNFVNRWDNALVQFARLINELQAAMLTEWMDSLYEDLSTSMGLDAERIDELFERAQTVWDNAKAMI